MSPIDTRLVYKSDLISFYEINTPRGKRVSLDMGCDAVLIVPRTKDGKCILTRQRRIGSESEVYEFPSGGIKSGEEPIDAASRELLEETGAKGILTFVTKVEPLSGLVKFNLSIFLADVEEVSDSNKNLEEHENVETLIVSMDELLQMICSMEVVDGYLLLGLGALYLKT